LLLLFPVSVIMLFNLLLMVIVVSANTAFRSLALVLLPPNKYVCRYQLDLRNGENYSSKTLGAIFGGAVFIQNFVISQH
jgi:hypothetical protein